MKLKIQSPSLFKSLKQGGGAASAQLASHLLPYAFKITSSSIMRDDNPSVLEVWTLAAIFPFHSSFRALR